MSDPKRYRRGKTSGMYLDKETREPVVASQFVEQGVAMWIVDDLVGGAALMGSDTFAARYSMPV
ncbi:hypothetical protein SEA_PICKLES13_10 [Microbacterium phage Pickles13]|nr:hypothetical protein SEA_PICKLES13_10 [Microbacterium phage Pickles13]